MNVFVYSWRGPMSTHQSTSEEGLSLPPPPLPPPATTTAPTTTTDKMMEPMVPIPEAKPEAPVPAENTIPTTFSALTATTPKRPTVISKLPTPTARVTLKSYKSTYTRMSLETKMGFQKPLLMVLSTWIKTSTVKLTRALERWRLQTKYETYEKSRPGCQEVHVNVSGLMKMFAVRRKQRLLRTVLRALLAAGERIEGERPGTRFS